MLTVQRASQPCRLRNEKFHGVSHQLWEVLLLFVLLDLGSYHHLHPMAHGRARELLMGQLLPSWWGQIPLWPKQSLHSTIQATLGTSEAWTWEQGRASSTERHWPPWAQAADVLPDHILTGSVQFSEELSFLSTDFSIIFSQHCKSWFSETAGMLIGWLYGNWVILLCSWLLQASAHGEPLVGNQTHHLQMSFTHLTHKPI